MDWGDRECLAGLLRLWVTRVLKRTRRVQPLADHLLELGWVTQSPRQMELTLNEFGFSRLPDLLDRVWPEWQEALQKLQNQGLPLKAGSLVKLARKSSALPPLPSRLHRKIYAAIESPHSKCLPSKKALPQNIVLTTDGVLRIRASEGLVLRLGTQEISCDVLMAVFGEVILPERALLDGIGLRGVFPKGVMTVENLGPFVDMPKPRELLLVHQPGWNTPFSQQFIKMLGPEPPWYHFGDLDPDGIAIYQHLNQEERKASLFIPSFWDEYEKAFSQPLSNAWPEKIMKSFSEPLLRRLFANNTWLEQEPIILDERLNFELARLV